MINDSGSGCGITSSDFEPKETPSSRDDICECLQRQAATIGESVRALASAVSTAVMQQGKDIGKIIARIERVARDQIRKQDAIIVAIVQHLAATARSQVAENGIRINMVREQLPGQAPQRPALPQPNIGEPPPGEEERPEEEQATQEPETPEPEKQEKPPPKEGDCNPTQPPYQSKDDIWIDAPWGKTRDGQASHASKWGKLLIEEALTKFDPICTTLSAIDTKSPIATLDSLYVPRPFEAAEFGLGSDVDPHRIYNR